MRFTLLIICLLSVMTAESQQKPYKRDYIRLGDSAKQFISLEVHRNVDSKTLIKYIPVKEDTVHHEVQRELAILDFGTFFQVTKSVLTDEFHFTISDADESIIMSLYYEIEAHKSDIPIAGKLHVYEKVNVYDWGNNDVFRHAKINGVSLEVSDGEIKNLKVNVQIQSDGFKSYTDTIITKKEVNFLFGLFKIVPKADTLSADMIEELNKKMNEIELCFENLTPISSSVKRDFRKYWKKRELFATIMNPITKQPKYFKINLGDVLNFEPYLGDGRKDYSIGDNVYNLSPGTHYVNRNPTSELFRLNVFTDLTGFVEDNPNSLVQFEVQKKFNLFTTSLQHRYYSTSFKVIPHFTPFFSIINLDKNKCYLPIKAFTSTDGEQKQYSLFMDVKQREAYDFGLDLCYFSIDVPTLKFYVDFGGRIKSSYNYYKQSDLIGENEEESEDISKTFSSYEYSPAYCSFRYRPDERYGLNVRFDPWIFYETSSDAISLSSQVIEDGANSDEADYQEKFKYRKLEFEGFFKPNKKDKFFFRYRYNFENGFKNNNFTQLQIGYSRFLSIKKETFNF